MKQYTRTTASELPVARNMPPRHQTPTVCDGQTSCTQHASANHKSSQILPLIHAVQDLFQDKKELIC